MRLGVIQTQALTLTLTLDPNLDPNPNPSPHPHPHPHRNSHPHPNLEPGGFHLGRGSSLRYNPIGPHEHAHPAFRPLEAAAATAAATAQQVRAAARHAVG